MKVTGRAVGKKAAFRSAMAPGLLILTLLAGCAPRAGLFPVDGGKLRGEELQDEKDFLGLPRAVRQSISYYRRLPEKATFRYGEYVYTAVLHGGSGEEVQEAAQHHPSPTTTSHTFRLEIQATLAGPSCGT